MLSIKNIQDITENELVAEPYDLILVASGYEERCTFVSEYLPNLRGTEARVFGFREVSTSESRVRNDRILKKRWGREPEILSADDDKQMYAALSEVCGTKSSLRIAIDYSSMSRLWYAAALNWCRFAFRCKQVTIDFIYSPGIYPETRQQMVIQQILAIPGCEGGAIRRGKCVVAVGIGFSGLASLSTIDSLEADIVYAFMAASGPSQDYAKEVLHNNAAFVKETQAHVWELPLRSVEGAYRGLVEIVAPHRSVDEVILVPMGPKPHVLAAILVSMRFPEITCLRVGARRSASEMVKPAGEVACCRVEFGDV